MTAPRFTELVMKYVSSIVLIAMSLTAIMFVSPQLQAQSAECSTDDIQCLSDRRSEECEQPESLEGSCVGWLRRLERMDLSRSPEAQLIVATGYIFAANMSLSADDSASYREHSERIYREVLAQWPTGNYAYRAYRGLANLADSEQDSIALNRTALTFAPTESMAIAALARALESSGDQTDRREAADLYLEALDAAVGSPPWYFAFRAMQLYESIGQLDQMATVRAKVRIDSDAQRMSDEISSGQILQDLSRASDVLEIACDPYYAAILGAETCTNAVDTLASGASQSSGPTAETQAFVEVASEGIRLLRIIEEDTLTEGETSRRQAVYSEHLQRWIENGTATASTYVRLANLQSGLNQRVAAMEKAVELAPSNGLYRYWLALGYMEQGRSDDALEHLQLARETVQEIPGLSRAQIDSQIRQLESSRRARP